MLAVGGQMPLLGDEAATDHRTPQSRCHAADSDS
jgi:hypothetical protein